MSEGPPQMPGARGERIVEAAAVVQAEGVTAGEAQSVAYRGEMVPLPAEMLTYSQQTGRPGMVTAIGVVSIVVAVLSLFGSAMESLEGMVFVMARRMSSQMSTTTSATATSSLTAADRAAAVGALTAIRPMSAGRRGQLDALLAQEGDSVLPDIGPGMTAGNAAKAFADGGAVADANDPSAAAGDGFKAKQGQVEVYDDRAVFTPSDGSAATTAVATATTMGSVISANQLAAVLAKVNQQTRGKMTAAQVAALRSVLQSPGQTLVPARGSMASVTATMMPNGQVFVALPGGNMMLASTGQVISQYSTSGGGMALANPFGTVPWGPLALLVGEAVASLGLAVFLMVIGIMAVRGSAIGLRLHWIYVVAKILLTAVSILAIESLVQRLSANTGGSWGATISLLILLLLGCGYPVGLIFALRSRGVREYVRAPEAGRLV